MSHSLWARILPPPACDQNVVTNMLMEKLILRSWLTLVAFVLLSTALWWIAACFTIGDEVASHRHHLWALFVINYQSRVIDLLFPVVILCCWYRARQIFHPQLPRHGCVRMVPADDEHDVQAEIQSRHIDVPQEPGPPGRS